MIDLEKLLAPISEEAPTGVNLRDRAGDLTFQTLEEQRTEIAPEDDPTGAGRAANWKAVVSGCEEALAASTKDLELAVRLTEGLSRTHGFEGLTTGIRLVTELTQSFWDRLHPGLEAEGEIVLPVRARPLSWLGSSKDFLRAAAGCPILSGADGRQLSWQDYNNSMLVDEKRTLSDPSQYEDMLAAGYISGEEWNARLAAAPPAELRQVLADVIRGQEALDELRALAEKQFGSDDAPSFMGLGEVLFDIREYLEQRVPKEEEAVGGEAVAGAEGAAAAAPAAQTGPIGSREDALRRLGEVADYFRRTEPHSPISYLVERAVRWGHMPLMEVLEEFVEDPTALARIQHNLGIRGSERTEE
jgi:type VI secretion system protein ImpA